MEKFEKREALPMEKYLKAVSEMYSQFEKREALPMEKYIGRLVKCGGKALEVVGYSVDTHWYGYLIADASLLGGWRDLNADDVVFKRCKCYWYATIDNLID